MPFVCASQTAQDPVPFDYLKHDDKFSFDINLDVLIKVPELGDAETVLCKSNFRNMYWTMNVRPGDLLASGTISGDTRDSFGSMLEIAWRGSTPFFFDTEGKVKRVFLQDGDTVTIKGKFYEILKSND